MAYFFALCGLERHISPTFLNESLYMANLVCCEWLIVVWNVAFVFVCGITVGGWFTNGFAYKAWRYHGTVEEE